MKKIIVLVIVAALAWHYRANLPFGQAGGYYHEDGSIRVVMYTGKDNVCGKPCSDMERHLSKLQVSYDSRVIDPYSEEDRKELHRFTGGRNSLPALVLGDVVVQEYHELQLPYDIAATLGLDYLSSKKADIIRANHFNSDGSPKVIMYGTAWCPYCKKARDYLEQNNIAYVEADVEKSSTDMRNFKALGGGGYPLLFVGARAMTGYNPQRLKTLTSQL